MSQFSSSQQLVASSMGSSPVGAVLVLGGGIAGMRSALDLANSGYLVHLVTEQSSIGGKMTQLDKTFPTNECAMCLLGPTMTDTQSHPNIRIHTVSTVVGLEGEAGNYKAKVKKAPRYINIDECTACGDCEEVCPVSVQNNFNIDMNQRKAVHKLFPQAVPNKYLIEKRGIPPCRSTCPAGCNAQGYIALISQGKFKEALEVVYRNLPFAGICGRACHHPCEGECNRGEIDQPLAISQLKRAAFDYGWDQLVAETPPPEIIPRSEKVAIIGAGPAGLTAAKDLALQGYQVTIFDAMPRPGGMLRYGIPRYRLPEEVIDKEILLILNLGVKLVSNTKVGRDITLDEIRKQGFKAILVATGAQESRKLSIEGADYEGILYGMEFLRDINLGKLAQIGSKVLVIGGGNVAIDVACSAKRLGAQEVHVACLESREEMPAHRWEIEEALEEGIEIHNSWGPQRFLGQGGRVTGVEMKGVASVFDAERRFNPQYTDELKVFDADTVIVTIGQVSDLAFLAQEKLEYNRNNTIKNDSLTKSTAVSDIFICGDVGHGPASVVAAVGSAHEAAISIHRYLNGQDLVENRILEKPEKLTPPPNVVPYLVNRIEQKHAAPEERSKDWREVYLGLTQEEAVEEAKRCLNCGVCSECMQCVKACKKQAVDHDQQEEVVEIEIGSVLLAPGYDLFDAKLKGEYGYGIYSNVITSLQFERLLSSTGPTKGHVTRPSDHNAPKKVAFIQCVGSRDCGNGAEYCSSICCMYSTKEAIIAKEHDKELEPTIFYLDMRSFGKNFDRYMESAKAQGVRYVRSMISSVKEDPVTKNLFLQYMKDGEMVSEEFDMVVLAAGVQPPKSAVQLAETFGIELNEYGFAKTDSYAPTRTTRDGIFVAGAFQGPRDIPETVMNASAAAATAGSVIAGARGQLVKPKEYPQEKDVYQEKPRVGVFVCHCGINIGSVVDVPQVVEFAKGLPNVVHAEEFLYSCSQDTLKQIKEKVQEKGLNRVVVASCTIRTHQPLFRESIREAGLNQFLFEMANIRDQCSWVHRDDPALATAKAKDLVHMAVSKVQHHEPLHLVPVPVIPKALIIGGGIAGMTAALTLAKQGYESYIVEREKQLGGNLRNLYRNIKGEDLQVLLRKTLEEVQSNDKITVFTNGLIEEMSGHQGHFITTISIGESGPRKLQRVEHGVVIIATGAKEMVPNAYLYGRNKQVITNLNLEYGLYHGEDYSQKRTIAFIQCVGSRDEERKYCSRTCCLQSVKNALAIKERNPEAQIYVFYRDMRTYGYSEKYYRLAREKGVMFVPVEDGNPPVVRELANGAIELEAMDGASRTLVTLQPDLVVLATASEAYEGAEKLASQLKLPINEDRFFVETHAKLAPIDFPSAGIFLCGAAHSPKFIDESIYQAEGAVARALSILSKPNLMVGGVVAKVDQSKCAACLTCLRACPFNVPVIDETRKAHIEAVQCQGCGTCAGECPAKAIQLQHYKDEQILAKVSGLYQEVR